ncbi:putative isopenicillin n protein [Coleophoma cylindrospora]|uniref:Putative isopenicillin n protein n=1 Tax=Coleophoma cylindrospora TaxID=1849047 RepID=A0A3D8QFY2_9HELO|nr:putative isopenicillin n protein [Coleophoma cylindrospora]
MATSPTAPAPLPASTTEFTSFSGNKRTLTSNVARLATASEIPTISLQAPHAEILRALRDACTRVGFFYISDTGVAPEVIAEAFDTARRFFAQPDDEKMRVFFKKSRILRGYEPPARVRTDESKLPDLNEAFNWGYERGLDPLVQETDDEKAEPLWDPSNSMAGPNAWPADAAFKATLATYYAQMITLARRLIQLFAEVLGLPATHFDTLVQTPGAMCRLIHYPPQPATQSIDGALGIGAHTDIECFTILCQDPDPRVAGLQILNAAGEWLQAPAVAGTFVVNIGDMLARWTNDVFISTVHRVLNVSGRERYSIPFFFGVDYAAEIRTLETCLLPGEKGRYEPVNAGDYVYRRLARSRLPEEEREKRGGKGVAVVG